MASGRFCSTDVPLYPCVKMTVNLTSNKNFVDSDQMVMADMAYSFTRGCVPEPYF